MPFCKTRRRKGHEPKALTITWTRKARTLSPHLIEEVELRIRRLHPYFPEMKRRITIGLTRSYDGLAFQSDEGTVKLMLDVRRARNGDYKSPTYWTIAHELMHLVQFNTKGIPAGERACDLYALARLPPKLIDDSPSYLSLPEKARETWGRDRATLAHRLAIKAIEKREQGLRNYICWWEETFERLASKVRK
jgi:hypothetical protein